MSPSPTTLALGLVVATWSSVAHADETASAKAEPDFSLGLSRVTVTPRIGIAFPGEVTPRKVSRTKVGVGFPLHVDAMIALHRIVELGPYLHYAWRPIKVREGSTTEGQAAHVVSLGAAVKVRIRTSKRSRLRIGALLGYNLVRQDFESAVGEGKIAGHGLSFAPSLEWSHDVARHAAINVMFSMITQVAGRADLGELGALVEGGSKQKLTFPPLAFLAIGMDFGFGRVPDRTR